MIIGSLCTGYGGLDHAVMDVLGGDLAWVADPDPGASKILAHHHPSIPNLGDITQVDWSTIPPVDVLTAGFPCQPVSVAGRRDGTDDERWLFDDICDAIGRMVTRPRLLVFENVPGLLTANRGHAMARVVHGLAALGYVGSWRVVAAADVGAPHRRERVFIAAWHAPHPDRQSQQRRRDTDDMDRAEHSPRPSLWSSPVHRVATAEDSDLEPQPEQWTAPGQTEIRRTQSESGRRSRTPPSDTDDFGRPRPGTPRDRRDGPADHRRAPADSQGDGREQGRAEPARIKRRLGATSGSGTDWGPYEPAITRWEHVTGRTAPPPTELNSKSRPVLSPLFVEWMMGLPDGHVTAPEIGLSRAAQLRALGNGVVPQQGAYALRLLLNTAQGVTVEA